MLFRSIINYNTESLNLSDMESGLNYAGKDSKAYLIKDKEVFYLFVDHMYYNDMKYFHLYKIYNGKIETVLEDFGYIDFVGSNYIIGYTYLGMIGYQKCEFKKIFMNGKFELDGEYKVSGNSDKYPSWKFYTLVNDLPYNEYDVNTKQITASKLKSGTKIRTISTDAKSYIKIETDKGLTGKVKIDRVDNELNSVYRDFVVNGQLFMKYYFLDGTKYIDDVYCSIPAY